MTEKKPLTTLDLHGEFPCTVIKSPVGSLQLRIDLRQSTAQTFANILHQHLALYAGAEVHGISASNAIGDMHNYHQLLFDLPASPQQGAQVEFKILGKPIMSLVYKNDRWEEDPASVWNKLAPHEIRALGMPLREDILPMLPYSRDLRKGYDPKRHAPITDLHTHCSAQISAQDLFTIANDADTQEHPIAYPVELIEMLASGSTERQRAQGKIIRVPSRTFYPLRHEGLECEQSGTQCEAIRLHDLTPQQRENIINNMRVMPDEKVSPTNFDREMYRYRNPFVKHPALTKAMLKKEAEAYARMGIEYATLSTGAMLEQEWFQAMEEAIDEIEKEGGVLVDGERRPIHLRFVVGVPRNISPEETFIALNKVKFLARHPYIVGMDVNGYESSKARRLFWALAHMGMWVRTSHANPQEAHWNFSDKFIMQVHAGETSKNQDNMGRAIALSRHYDIRVMIGHALSGTLTDDEKRWMSELSTDAARAKDRLLLQMCLESNQAFMAKPLVHRSPIVKRLNQAQCVQASDGAGALGSSPHSLAFAALAAGVTLDDLASMRAYEQGFIRRQMAREIKNRETFASVYGEGVDGSKKFLDAYKKYGREFPDPRNRKAISNWLPPEFDDKVPILIGGAAGSSWAKLEKLDQWEIEQLLDFVVASVDPKKAYFVLGRVQNEGVSKALDVAVNRFNKKHPETPFHILGRVAGSPTGELAETITWMQPIEGEPDKAALDMIRFLREKNGKALLFPGEDYTAEMILGANDPESPVANAFLVPRPRKTEDDQGKIFELAETLPASVQFTSDHGIRMTDVGKKNAAIDTFIDRMLQPGSPFIRNEEDRASILRDGIDLYQVKQEVLARWSKGHRTQIKEFVESSRGGGRST